MILNRMRRVLRGRESQLVPEQSPDTSTWLEPFHVEALENRQMLAGDVTFAVRGGNLIVNGDRADNQINVEVDSGDFLVNGENTGLAVSGLKNLTIKSKGGNDQVQIGSGFFVPGNLKIITAGGDDTVTILGGDVDGKTLVKTGGGNNVVTASDMVFFGPVKVATGGGNDAVNAAADGSGFVTFFEPLSVILGGGNDTLNVGVINYPSDLKPAEDVNALVGTVFIEDAALLNGGGGTDLLVIAGVAVDPDNIPTADGVRIQGFEAASP